jgi:hypothetical protein
MDGISSVELCTTHGWESVPQAHRDPDQRRNHGEYRAGERVQPPPTGRAVERQHHRIPRLTDKEDPPCSTARTHDLHAAVDVQVAPSYTWKM